MALIYQADLNPTKLQLLAAWLPSADWYEAPAAAEPGRIASYRFDDPAGEVGVETLLVRAGDATFQVPLTYRAAPLAGADEWLIGTTEHSILGTRWVYDGCGDPVYAALLTGAIVADAGQAVQYLAKDGETVPYPPTMTIAGGGAPGDEIPGVHEVRRVVPGDPTIIETDSVALCVVRRPGGAAKSGGLALTATWPGQAEAALLAYLRD